MTKQSLEKLAKSKQMKKRRQALTDPVRFQILGLLQRSENGLTAKELSSLVGKDTNRLYYHLRILEDAELIESNESRPTERMLERVFVYHDPGRFAWDIDDPVEMSDYLRAQMEVSRLDGERAIFAWAEAARTSKDSDMLASWGSPSFMTTHEEFKEFCDRIFALQQEFRARGKRLREDGGPNWDGPKPEESFKRIEFFFLASEHDPSSFNGKRRTDEQDEASESHSGSDPSS